VSSKCVGRTDREQLQKLYEEHARGLLAYACSFVTGFASAEDALHQVFERLLRGDIEIEGAPGPYLYRAIRNTCLNQIRNRSREVELDDRWFEGPPGMKETGIFLQSALQELPEEQRQIIMLHIWGELSFEESASVLGISPNTAASRYRYGLSKLREQFKTATKI
jgi:RNA polymerase sigma-70 factor, ECF subfamily